MASVLRCSACKYIMFVDVHNLACRLQDGDATK